MNNWFEKSGKNNKLLLSCYQNKELPGSSIVYPSFNINYQQFTSKLNFRRLSQKFYYKDKIKKLSILRCMYLIPLKKGVRLFVSHHYQ